MAATMYRSKNKWQNVQKQHKNRHRNNGGWSSKNSLTKFCNRYIKNDEYTNEIYDYNYYNNLNNNSLPQTNWICSRCTYCNVKCNSYCLICEFPFNSHNKNQENKQKSNNEYDTNPITFGQYLPNSFKKEQKKYEKQQIDQLITDDEMDEAVQIALFLSLNTENNSNDNNDDDNNDNEELIYANMDIDDNKEIDDDYLTITQQIKQINDQDNTLTVSTNKKYTKDTLLKCRNILKQAEPENEYENIEKIFSKQPDIKSLMKHNKLFNFSDDNDEEYIYEHMDIDDGKDVDDDYLTIYQQIKQINDKPLSTPVNRKYSKSFLLNARTSFMQQNKTINNIFGNDPDFKCLIKTNALSDGTVNDNNNGDVAVDDELIYQHMEIDCGQYDTDDDDDECLTITQQIKKIEQKHLNQVNRQQQMRLFNKPNDNKYSKGFLLHSRKMFMQNDTKKTIQSIFGNDAAIQCLIKKDALLDTTVDDDELIYQHMEIDAGQYDNDDDYLTITQQMKQIENQTTQFDPNAHGKDKKYTKSFLFKARQAFMEKEPVNEQKAIKNKDVQCLIQNNKLFDTTDDNDQELIYKDMDIDAEQDVDDEYLTINQQTKQIDDKYKYYDNKDIIKSLKKAKNRKYSKSFLLTTRKIYMEQDKDNQNKQVDAYDAYDFGAKWDEIFPNNKINRVNINKLKAIKTVLKQDPNDVDKDQQDDGRI